MTTNIEAHIARELDKMTATGKFRICNFDDYDGPTARPPRWTLHRPPNLPAKAPEVPKVTIPPAEWFKQAHDEIQGVAVPKFADILQASCDYFKIHRLEVLGCGRQTRLKFPRFVTCYIAMKHTKLSKAHIANRLNRDHSTCLSAMKTIAREMDIYGPHIAAVEKILGLGR